MFEIAWRSEDRQGSMPMGEYVSLDVARRELPTCQAELLAQCLDDVEDPTGAGGLMTKAACLKGTWVVYDTDDDKGVTLEVECMDTYHATIVGALTAFAEQRPGLEPGNSISHWSDGAGRKAYRSESRAITRDLHDARVMLGQVAWKTYTAAQWEYALSTAFSGRLSWDGSNLEYCTGQYWPTEYRKAVCAVLSLLLWRDRISDDAAVPYEKRDREAVAYWQRVVGRGVASRWFR